MAKIRKTRKMKIAALKKKTMQRTSRHLLRRRLVAFKQPLAAQVFNSALFQALFLKERYESDSDSSEYNPEDATKLAEDDESSTASNSEEEEEETDDEEINNVEI
jgi:hypothetical protein